MLQFSGKCGRFGAREAIAKAWRKVKRGGRAKAALQALEAVINRARQAFAYMVQSAYSAAVMPDDRIASAFDRIEAALGRIERSARAPLPMPPRSPQADADLEARHAQLRKSVGASLVELDQLIERLQG
ncbi:MAG: hypothetical protein KKE69_05550 [Alphaproteobacteria bacterium]|nr:hypothetical protein [Alphaproteobacteria bacterium]